MSDHPIATIQKNAREELRISLSEFRGYNLVSQRVWFRAEEGDWRPSKAGVVVRVERLPDLVAALTSALAEAERQGLVGVPHG